ncbi:MAG: hypothetical protein ACOX8B_05360, partial [Lachnospiraceae bacterium]
GKIGTVSRGQLLYDIILPNLCQAFFPVFLNYFHRCADSGVYGGNCQELFLLSANSWAADPDSAK